MEHLLIVIDRKRSRVTGGGGGSSTYSDDDVAISIYIYRIYGGRVVRVSPDRRLFIPKPFPFPSPLLYLAIPVRREDAGPALDDMCVWAGRGRTRGAGESATQKKRHRPPPRPVRMAARPPRPPRWPLAPLLTRVVVEVDTPRVRIRSSALASGHRG